MLRTLMKSKVHRATVTAANLHYVGSLTLDRDLMVGADLVPHERVQVLDIDNGTRLETYLIEGEPGSGELCINGAAARLVQPGDRVILVSYGIYTDAEARAHVPLVVVCDERNRAAATVRAETPSTTSSELIGSAR